MAQRDARAAGIASDAGDTTDLIQDHLWARFFRGLIPTLDKRRFRVHHVDIAGPISQIRLLYLGIVAKTGTGQPYSAGTSHLAAQL